MRWAPNPYALAQLLSGELSNEELLQADGSSADAFLKKALLRPELQSVLASLHQFQVLAAQAEPLPTPLAERMEEPLVEKAISMFGREAVERALPLLLPVSDPTINNLTLGDAVTSLNNRVGRLADAEELLITNASFLDPMQGDVGDCYLIATIIALAWTKPELLTARLQGAGFASPQRSFEWQFHDDAGAVRGRRSVTGRIPVRGSLPRYARSATGGEHWPGLLEKAFVMHMRPASSSTDEPTRGDYLSIDRDTTPPRACRLLVGGATRGKRVQDETDESMFVDALSNSPLHTPTGVMTKPVTAWTKKDLGSTDPKVWDKTGLWPSHAYAVLGVIMESKHIVLRNPHGIATERREGYAEGPWKPADEEIELNKHGTFALSPELFRKHFKDIGWVDGL